jgi:hypothetical protein
MALLPFECEDGTQCLVCGATGSYDLLVARVHAIQAAWAAAGRYPDTNTDRAAIEQAIDDAVAAIGMESA